MRLTAEVLPARQVREVDVPDPATGFSLLKALGLAPDAHLLVRGDVPIPLDEPLVNGERLRILAVVSGG